MIEVTPIPLNWGGAGDGIGVLRKVVRFGCRSSGKTTSEFQGEPSMVRRTLMAPLILAALTPPAAAAGDAGAGQKVFSFYCTRCHQIGETAKNAVGPKLNGLFGRPAGSIEGFSYSSANKNSRIVWDEATFREYIKGPKEKVPGTKMDFPGLKTQKEIDDIVAFLNQFGADGKKK
jgi:cytochrome c